MVAFSTSLSPSATRFIVGGSHLFVWISSLIVVGITGYFLKNFDHDGHLIFEIVISALVLVFWLPSFVLPFFGTYKPYYAPLNFIFSYLWLTSFIFTAQDYNKGSCKLNAPFYGHCSLKLANEAFIFLAFFFTLVSLLTDVVAWRSAAAAVNNNGVAAGHHEKDIRPSADTAPTAVV